MRIRLKQAIVGTQRTQRAWSLRWRIPEGRLSMLIAGRCQPTEREERVIVRDLGVPADELFAESREVA